MGTPYDSDIGKLLCQHPHGLGMKVKRYTYDLQNYKPGQYILLTERHSMAVTNFLSKNDAFHVFQN